ncbi:MAG: InlB B-repeat-containing protein, partial [Candidatus Peribacteria bacterium]|nr:InlB B-repeat-containing protein [Candidatus Peribacteria bacterium]
MTMCISNTTTCSSRETYTTSKARTLPTTDGTKTVYVQYKDAAGNVSSQYSDSIILDTTAPTVAFDPDGNTTYAKSHASKVTVTDATAGVNASSLKYQRTTGSTAPDENTFSSTFTSAGTITKSDGNGAFYLRILAKDNAGNTTITKSGIFNFDNTVPTGSITINNKPYTSSTSVSLTLSATDNVGVTQMCISNTTTCSSSWETYATSTTRTLDTGNGNKTVYVRFRDAAGNISSQYSDTVRMDTTSYTITIDRNGGGTVSNPTNYTISGSNQTRTLTRPSVPAVTYASGTTYTVSFNSQSGTPTPGNLTSTNTITKTSLFDTWTITTNSSPTTSSVNSSTNVLSIPASATGNITVRANWSVSASTGAYPSVTLPTAPTKNGYTFSGWYTATSCGGTKAGEAGASYTPTGNSTLYACWKVVSYTIT